MFSSGETKRRKRGSRNRRSDSFSFEKEDRKKSDSVQEIRRRDEDATRLLTILNLAIVAAKRHNEISGSWQSERKC